jgi:hypothetical protein
VVVQAQGDERRSRDLLAAALDAAARWAEHSALAEVLDACAYCAIHRDQADADSAGELGRAELAARLLGAARAVRGAFDESGPDAPLARAAAREALGEAAFAAAYRSTADLTYEASVALARAGLEDRP